MAQQVRRGKTANRASFLVRFLADFGKVKWASSRRKSNGRSEPAKRGSFTLTASLETLAFSSPLRLFNGPPRQPSRVGSCHTAMVYGLGRILTGVSVRFCSFFFLSPDKCPDQAPGTDRGNASLRNEHLLLCSTQTLLERERRERLCFTLCRPSAELSIIYESKRVQM